MIKQLIKLTIFLLSLSTFLNADFLLYMEKKDSGFSSGGSKAYCITNYYYENQKLYFLQSNDDAYDNAELKDCKSIQISAGYILDIENDICLIANIDTTNYEATDELDMSNYTNFSYLGIPLAYFNSLMALCGLLISAIFLYGLTRFI